VLIQQRCVSRAKDLLAPPPRSLYYSFAHCYRRSPNLGSPGIKSVVTATFTFTLSSHPQSRVDNRTRYIKGKPNPLQLIRKRKVWIKFSKDLRKNNFYASSYIFCLHLFPVHVNFMAEIYELYVIKLYTSA
jgi:hypothetical protein